jgi:lipopolysaccharide transport system ATP-binding protein
LLLGGGEQKAFGETGEILDKYVYGENERRLEGKEAAEKETTPGEPKRWGDKKVSITGVKFLDKFGGESSIFSSFDPMTIRIFYNAPAMIRDPVFGIALYSEQDQHLYGTNTELKNITIDQIKGDGYIDLKIEMIPMLSGRFLLTVAVHSHEGKAYDWIDKQYSFEVLPKGRDAGMFEVPCRWVR